MKLKDALNTGKIERIQRLYRCNECNIMHDTPFEAIICYQSHVEVETKEVVYFSELNESTKRMLRREYSDDDFLYNKYESVAYYAYDVK